MQEWVFACLAPPGRGADQALLWAQSIRRFAGRTAGSDIWLFMPDTGEGWEQQNEAFFAASNVRILRLPFDQEVLNFPFAAKTIASAAAEARAQEEQKNLVWMDRGSLILQEPAPLQLPPETVLGYRPVDHMLIGSPMDRPADDFWKMVYGACEVPEERLFPMTTSVDQREIRPYFNAGMLVVRPEARILRTWAANFEKMYRTAEARAFYDQNNLYRIFIHQAVLSATILVLCEAEDMLELPHLINYPLHMHKDYPADRRPARMNDLVSCRYEAFFQDSAWATAIIVEEPLRTWLKEHL